MSRQEGSAQSATEKERRMQNPALSDDPMGVMEAVASGKIQLTPDSDTPEETADMLLLSVDQIVAMMHLADGDERLLRQLLAAMAQQAPRRRRRRRSKAKPE